ncbi:MAG: hypothetical protein ACYSUV_16970 [Planctomycetota bacterium]|jgi:hypothetical protein
MRLEIELEERDYKSLQEFADAQTGGDVKAVAALLLKQQLSGITFDDEGIWGLNPERGGGCE